MTDLNLSLVFALLLDEDDADMGQGSAQIQPPTGGKPRIGKSAKERLRKVVIGNSASDAVEGWHKVKYTLQHKYICTKV